MANLREAKREWDRKSRLSVQEIGPAPDLPTDDTWQKLRLESDESLQRHFEICYPQAFPLEWSPDHLRLIKDIERAADVGLLKALAMPRGSGKTTMMIRAGLWALLTARRRYCCVISATEIAARNLLKGIKTEIAYNESLLDIYPRELHAMRALENEPLRARGQKSGGELTGVEWLVDRIGFGNVKDVETSGAILTTCGITGNIRGQQVVTADGTILRPDLALIDDPQTKESAGSEKQCKDRHETMMGDVLGLAGPSSAISAITTCTIIYKGDLADRLLDRKLSEDWHGEICRLVYKWPTNQELWDKYASIRSEDLVQGGTGEKATEFYKANREAMDEGAEVGWPQRKGKELSALQYAYNLRLRDEAAYMAEYQNDPLNDHDAAPFNLDVDSLTKRTLNVNRGELPADADVITAFVDVQKEVLFYMVMAWSVKGHGVVIDYGTFPDQRRTYFSKSSIRFKLSDVLEAASIEAAVYDGLHKLTDDLLGRDVQREDGTVMRISRMAVDANWGQSTRTVRRFCYETKHRGRIYPSFGQFVGANSKPWHKFEAKQRDRQGVHCRLQAPPKRQWGSQELLIDVNWWKSFAAERLLAPIGEDNSIALFQEEPHRHRMIAEHFCAEDSVLVIGKTGNQCIEWRQNPGKPNNDYFDCLVGNCVLGSLEGVVVGKEEKPIKKLKRAKRRASPLAC